MSKHTEGPWNATGATGRNLLSYGQPWAVHGTEENMGQLIAGCFGDVRGGIEKAEANARLIAAAPDLLAALTELLDAEIYADAEGVWSVERGGCEDYDYREITKRARAAIAKATGKK